MVSSRPSAHPGPLRSVCSSMLLASWTGSPIGASWTDKHCILAWILAATAVTRTAVVYSSAQTGMADIASSGCHKMKWSKLKKRQEGPDEAQSLVLCKTPNIRIHASESCCFQQASVANHFVAAMPDAFLMHLLDLQIDGGACP